MKGNETSPIRKGEPEPLAQAAAAYQSAQIARAQPNDILTLQRTSGNQAVQRLLTKERPPAESIQRDDSQNNKRVKDSGEM